MQQSVPLNTFQNQCLMACQASAKKKTVIIKSCAGPFVRRIKTSLADADISGKLKLSAPAVFKPRCILPQRQRSLKIPSTYYEAKTCRPNSRPAELYPAGTPVTSASQRISMKSFTKCVNAEWEKNEEANNGYRTQPALIMPN
ncbi:hypothetical protein CBL_09102 [Carabus blaptoides fortunei]